MVKAHLTDHLS